MKGMPRRRSPGNLPRLYDRCRILFAMLGIRGLGKPRYPFYVNLVINSACNLRCTYCFGHYARRPQRQVPLPQLLALIDELAARGTRYILLQGGEPFLHPDLGAIIRHLRLRGMVVAISSNGQLPERIAAVPEIAWLDNICFSLDGAPPGNDRCRGAGAYARVMESIAAVKRHYPALTIRINAVAHRYVAGDVDHLAALVREHGLEWGVGFLFHGSEQADGEPLGLAADEIRAYLAAVLRHKQRGCPIFTASRILRYAADWPVAYQRAYLTAEEIHTLGWPGAIRCQYGNYELVIDEDGNLYPCQALQGQFPARNVYTDGFAAAFAHLQSKPCHTCCRISMINTSAMINWDWRVIGETVWDTLRWRAGR